MADQGQKTITIDDLVSELSKTPAPSAAPLPPVPEPLNSAPVATVPVRPVIPSQSNSMSIASVQPIPQSVAPKPMIPSAPAIPPQSGTMSVPVAKPIIPSQPSQPASTAQSPHSVREYQSSIRTMASDIASLKSGQQLSGISIPRKIDDKPALPTQTQPKTVIPNVPQQSVPWAKIEMGQLEKGTPINDPALKPTITNQAQNKPVPTPPIIIPPQKSRINRNILFASIAGFAVIAGIGYWLFVLRSPDQIVIVTPTPTPIVSATPTPTPTLKTILVNDPLIVSVASSGNPQSVLINAIKSSNITAKKVQAVETKTDTGTTSTILKPDELLSRLAVAYPSIMKSVFGEQDSHVYSYGQTESFNAKGILVPDALPSYRLVIVSEVKDSAITLASLRAWETSMAGDFNTLFELNHKKNIGVVFSDNTYRGSSIRYVNFPWPDRSIDYAVVRASNGKQYLVITNSRESIYATLDQLILK